MNSTIEAIIRSAKLGTMKNVSAVSGGSINEAYCIEKDDKRLFLKINEAARYPQMFETESAGLLLLSESDFVVPKPKVVGEHGNHQFIIMNWVEQGTQSGTFWIDFGTALANMHLLTADQFGLDHDNYIGSLNQINNWHSSWSDFYREERLIPQMKLADKKGLLTSRMKSGFKELFKSLDDLYPIENPSLLHGDLWSGNLMTTAAGKPCIFDPAVYYGHREIDLAMMALFGGFGDAWVDAYNEIHPLENGWRKRIEVGQLYPLMVHVNLFGGSYARSVENILSRYT